MNDDKPRLSLPAPLGIKILDAFIDASVVALRGILGARGCELASYIMAVCMIAWIPLVYPVMLKRYGDPPGILPGIVFTLGQISLLILWSFCIWASPPKKK